MRRRARGSIGRATTAVGGAMLAAVLLAGCVGPAPAESPSAPTPSVAVPEQTPSTPPVEGVAVSCDELIGDPGLAAVTAGAAATAPDGLWHVAAETVGGLSCGFASEGTSGQLVALPTARAGSVAAEDRATCEPAYDSVECIGVASGEGVTVAVAVEYPAEQPSMTEEITQIRDAARAAVVAAERVPVPAQAAPPRSCVDLADVVDPQTLLSSEEVFEDPIIEGALPFERRILEQASLVRACDWSELAEFRELEIVIVAGASDDWDVEADRMGGETVTVGDAPAQEEIEGERVRLLVRGASDLILLTGRGIEADLLRSAAQGILLR